MPQAGRQQQTWSHTSSRTLQGMNIRGMAMGGVYVFSMYACEFTYVACLFVIGGTEAPLAQEPQSAVQRNGDLFVCKLYTA